MKKKKLKLEDIKVDSFITSVEGKMFYGASYNNCTGGGGCYSGAGCEYLPGPSEGECKITFHDGTTPYPCHGAGGCEPGSPSPSPQSDSCRTGACAQSMHCNEGTANPTGCYC